MKARRKDQVALTFYYSVQCYVLHIKLNFKKRIIGLVSVLKV